MATLDKLPPFIEAPPPIDKPDDSTIKELEELIAIGNRRLKNISHCIGLLTILALVWSALVVILWINFVMSFSFENIGPPPAI